MMMGRRNSGAAITAIGATVTTISVGGTAYAVLSWPDAGTYSLVVDADITGDIDALIVAGGGGGMGSGGGAGGFRAHSRESLDAGTYPVVVGAGGDDANGSPSSVFGVESAGGGKGAINGGTAGVAGNSGGSGGGGWRSGSGGAGNTPAASPAQGYAGGSGAVSYRSTAGGGAGSVGGSTNITLQHDADGGLPAYSDITGESLPYSQGGPGFQNYGLVAPTQAVQPTAPGSGGRGSYYAGEERPGVTGIVIVRIPSAALGAITT